jgi:hypothetical protein
LPSPGPQQPPHALDVLALAHAAGDHDADLGVGDVDPLVEHLRRDQRPQRTGAEGRQRRLPLAAADVAGERHDQVLAGHRVGGLVVGHEDQRPLRAVVTEQERQGLPLAARVAEEPPGPMPGREAPPPLVG